MSLSNLEKRQMRESAFAYLTKYKPSTGKMRAYLLQKKYPLQEIDALINELTERNYLNDHVLASKLLIAYRGTKSRGRTALRLMLIKRGIALDSVELALNEFFELRSEKDLLADFLASACQSMLEELEQAEDYLSKRKILHKLMAKCLRRGFNSYDIRQALAEYLIIQTW